jgi:sigma-B regulation protein RsbU (phosphoserine phosphatase)
MSWHSKLPDQEHVERNSEGGGDFGGDWHAASGQAEHQHVGAVLVLHELCGQLSPGFGSVAEAHATASKGWSWIRAYPAAGIPTTAFLFPDACISRAGPAALYCSPVKLQLDVSDASGRRPVDVEATPFTIGRSSESHLPIADPQVSRQHAKLVQDGDVWMIIDCGSRSGTFLNGTRVESQPVRPGDILRIGQSELRVLGDQSSATGSAVFDFRQLNALFRGLRGLGSTKVLDEVLALVLDSALELTGAERGFVLLANDQGRLTPAIARAQGGITLGSAQTSGRIPEEVFATGNDRIVTDLMDEHHAAAHAGTVALGIRHVLCTPLNAMQFGAATDRKRIGVLYLDSRERGYLQHVTALHLLAAEAAVVIENARLYHAVLQKEREAHELKVAAQIQQALLPPPTYQDERVELAASSVPCRSVGGDLFEYASYGPEGLSFVVADVAGKGTSAALLTAVVQGLLAAEVDTARAPEDVMTRVNAALCRRSIEARFVTAFYGRLEVSGRLSYSNAGHNAPILLSSATVARLEATGCPLGLFDDVPYAGAEVPFGPGDLLVLFSDGVTEAVNAAGEEFGDDRLLACLDHVRNRPASDVLHAVLDAVRAFCGTEPARDDVTVMAVRAH